MENLDVEVAKAAGWTEFKTVRPYHTGTDEIQGIAPDSMPSSYTGKRMPQVLPRFTSSNTDAWKVATYLETKGWKWSALRTDSGFLFRFFKGVEADGTYIEYGAEKPTLPMAICMAAIRANGQTSP